MHAIDARLGGTLHYDMIADAPEQIAAMKQMGQPTSHETRGTFNEIKLHERPALTHLIDFLPGVTPYKNTMTVAFFPAAGSVRMVVTLEPMLSDEFTKMQAMGFTSQLTKLDKRFG